MNRAMEMSFDIAGVIQLALAPAFLLVGIGQFLQLAAGRLARVVDRARVVAAMLPETPGPEHDLLVAELKKLDRRMNVVNWAIFFATAAMIAVCLVVAALFLTHWMAVDLSLAIAASFIGIMALLIPGLVLFLWEVLLAYRTIHVRIDIVGRHIL